MVTLDQLRNAFSEIEKLSRPEEIFHIQDIAITVRPLSEQEGVDVMKYASVAFEHGSDGATSRDFTSRVKTATLGYAIVQIGSLDLRTSYVEDGTTESGTPIRREKFQVVRDFLAEVSPEFLSRLFARFGDFMSRVEISAEQSIQYNPVDIDAEIERHRSVISALEERKKEVEDQNAALNPIREVASAVQEDLAETSRMAQQTAQYASPVPVQSHTPQPAPIPAPQQSVEVSTPPVYSQLEEVRHGRTQHEQVQEMLNQDSAEDLQRRNAEILAQKRAAREQHEQMLQERQAEIEARRAIKQARAEQTSAPVRRATRQPPHAAAKRTSMTLQGVEDGIEVYRPDVIPELSTRGRAPTPDGQKVQVDAPVSGNTNPMFRNPRSGSR